MMEQHCSIAPSNMIAPPASLSHVAVRKCPPARSHVQSTKRPETLRAISPKTDAYVRSRRERKKIEMLFAHVKRILRLDRLRLRGPLGAQDEFLFAATAQNLPKLAKLIQVPALQPA
jgi:DDE family transposase